MGGRVVRVGVLMGTACGSNTSARSRGPKPSAIRMRVAFGESWMPAPVSSSRSACSKSVTRNPLCASISAALKPPMPAPAIRTLRDDATALLRSGGFGQGAGFRPRRMRIQGRIVPIERRAIRADDLLVAAHIEEHMRMVERRLGADAHEFARANLDHRRARVVVEMGNDVIGHGFVKLWFRKALAWKRCSAPHHSGPHRGFLGRAFSKSSN